jgi:uncharacterized protein YoxC
VENEKLFELMEKMYIELQGIKKNVDGLDKKVDNLDKKVDDLDRKVDDLDKTVLHMEQEHGKKLEALFDGYKQNSEQLNRIEKEVSKHEEVILRRIK